MSVINKMLRDLDQRHAPDDAAPPKAGAARLRTGTASVAPGLNLPGGRGARGPRLGLRLGLGLAASAAVAVLGAGVWWSVGGRPVAAPTANAPLAATLPPSALSEPPLLVPVPGAVGPVVVATAPLIARPTAPPAGVRAPASPAAVVRAPASPAAVVRAPASPPAAAAGKAPVSPLPPAAVSSSNAALVASIPASASASSRPVVLAPVAPPADGQPGLQRQQQAGRDALVQAQTLWNAGSHDAATDLLQQAVGMAERSANGSGQNQSQSQSQTQTQTLASLARELARMQLADGRASAAADMLARLQPQLAQEADIWALRGNAAQRLGRHQESVSDYSAALQLRPNEQRWLLGAAVSLAAQGQTANAAAMAERARAVGPIAREVQTYLRQAGVQLREP